MGVVNIYWCQLSVILDLYRDSPTYWGRKVQSYITKTCVGDIRCLETLTLRNKNKTMLERQHAPPSHILNSSVLIVQLPFSLQFNNTIRNNYSAPKLCRNYPAKCYGRLHQI